MFHSAGRSDDAQQLSAQAMKMRDAILERMTDSDTNLFLDGVFSPSNVSKYHSAISSQYFPVGFGVLAQATSTQQALMGAAIMKLVINKTLAQAVEPACSCMGAHWLLEALYTLARSTPPEPRRQWRCDSAGVECRTCNSDTQRYRILDDARTFHIHVLRV